MGRYPANNLIPRRPVPRRQDFGPHRMPDADVAGNYPQFPAAMPNHGVGYRRLTHPCATGPALRTGPVRLACLIHAANVHSEPGSNPSKMSRSPAMRRLRGHPPAPGPHPKGLRKNDWSHRRSASVAIGRRLRPDPPSRATRAPLPSVSPPHEGRVPVLASHPDAPIPVDPPGGVSSRSLARRLPSRVLDATNSYLRLVVFG